MNIQSAEKTVVMGVLNTTPDSFSDGGQFNSLDLALSHAKQLIDDGADILDIGGESTRPGAEKVPVNVELKRTIPLIQQIRSFSAVPISIDSSKPEVMSAAVSAGANMINDVQALSLPNALETAAELAVPVCLMHMQGNPQTMQDNPSYRDVVTEVSDFLQQRIDSAIAAGISQDKIVIDPGFGFGKTLQQNLQLLDRLPSLRKLGCSILAGLSRKSMIGLILDQPVEQRLQGSVSAAVIAAMKGASIVRVHDVKQTAEALAIVDAMRTANAQQ